VSVKSVILCSFLEIFDFTVGLGKIVIKIGSHKNRNTMIITTMHININIIIVILI